MLNTAAIIPAFTKGTLRTRKDVRTTKDKTVTIGPCVEGYPIAVQSMTKVHTTDVQACVHQVKQLASAGCALCESLCLRSRYKGVCKNRGKIAHPARGGYSFLSSTGD